MDTEDPTTIVLGGYVTALSAVRTLAAAAIPAVVVPFSAFEIAPRSRWATETARLGPGETRAALLSLLRVRADRWKGRLLLPTADPAVEVLARHHAELSRTYRLITPPWEVTRQILVKEATYEAARRAGVVCPACYGPAAPELLTAELRYPVLLRPSMSTEFLARTGRKAIVADNPAELRAALRRIEETGLSATAYDFIPGPDSAYFNYLTYVDRQGAEVGGLAVRKVRKAPPRLGVGCVVTNDVDPATADRLRASTLALLKAVRWTGPASAEFKLDLRDGQLKFIEVNGRQSLVMGIGPAAGVPFPVLAWREAVEGDVRGVSQNGWRGYWIHEMGDIVHNFLPGLADGGGPRRFAVPYRSPHALAVWSRRDPWPFFWQWLLAACEKLYRRWRRGAA